MALAAGKDSTKIQNGGGRGLQRSSAEAKVNRIHSFRGLKFLSPEALQSPKVPLKDEYNENEIASEMRPIPPVIPKIGGDFKSSLVINTENLREIEKEPEHDDGKLLDLNSNVEDSL